VGAYHASAFSFSRWRMLRNGYEPAIMTLHSTSDSGSLCGFLKKKMSSVIFSHGDCSNILISKLKASTDEDPSGQVRTINLSSVIEERMRWCVEGDGIAILGQSRLISGFFSVPPLL
jgi:hypothetical protein